MLLSLSLSYIHAASYYHCSHSFFSLGQSRKFKHEFCGLVQWRWNKWCLFAHRSGWFRGVERGSSNSYIPMWMLYWLVIILYLGGAMTVVMNSGFSRRRESRGSHEEGWGLTYLDLTLVRLVVVSIFLNCMWCSKKGLRISGWVEGSLLS